MSGLRLAASLAARRGNATSPAVRAVLDLVLIGIGAVVRRLGQDMARARLDGADGGEPGVLPSGLSTPVDHVVPAIDTARQAPGRDRREAAPPFAGVPRALPVDAVDPVVDAGRIEAADLRDTPDRRLRAAFDADRAMAMGCFLPLDRARLGGERRAAGVALAPRGRATGPAAAIGL